jgi:hypothetical protein
VKKYELRSETGRRHDVDVDIDVDVNVNADVDVEVDVDIDFNKSAIASQIASLSDSIPRVL